MVARGVASGGDKVGGEGGGKDNGKGGGGGGGKDGGVGSSFVVMVASGSSKGGG